MILESEYFEDENEDLLIIKNMKRIKCKVLQEGYKQTLMNFYLCSCDPQKKKPICEECALICHSGHILGDKFQDQLVCSCGKKNHKVTDTPKQIYTYDPTCMFNEMSKLSRLNIYYTSNDIVSCFICKHFCFDEIDETNWTEKKDEILPTCSCKGHSNSKLIYKYINEVSKFNKIEYLTHTHWLNLIFLSQSFYENNYLFLKNYFEKLKKKLNNYYEFDPNIQLSNQYLALANLASLANYCHLQNYYQPSVKDLFNRDIIYRLLKLPFNEDSIHIWILKNNIICCFEKIVFESDFVGLPGFRITDYLNFSPIQRIIYNKNIQLYPKIIENYIENPKNLINEFFSGITNLIKSKNFNLVGYDILYRLLNIIKELAKYNLFKTDQEFRYFNLVDNILTFFHSYSSINDKDQRYLKQIKAKEMLVLECICKTLLYMSFNLNDDVIKNLFLNNLDFENFKFFHVKNPIAKGITRNSINILNYAKICISNNSQSNDDICLNNQLSKSFDTPRDKKDLIYQDRFERDYKEAIKNVLSWCTHIISLCVNKPDVYILGFKRLLNNSDLPFYKNLFNSQLQSNEISFLEYIKSSIYLIENDIYGFYNFTVSIHDLVNNTINNISSLFSKNKIEYTIPDIPINYHFSEQIIPKNEIFYKLRKSSNPNHRKFRILLNNSSFIYSIIKVLSIFNQYHFTSTEEKITLELKLIDSILKLYYFYVEDNPDNCIAILSKEFLNDLLKVRGESIEKIFIFQYFCLKWISINLVEVEDVTLWEKFSFKLYEKSLLMKDHLNSLLLLLKIFKILVNDIPSLAHSYLIKKIRGSLLEIIKKSPCIKEYFSQLLTNEVDNIRSDNVDESNSITYRKEEKEKMAKIFYKYMNIMNKIFDENCLYVNSFLSELFVKNDIRIALKSNNLNLKIRTELLCFFRVVYMDVYVDVKKIPFYMSEFSSQLHGNSESQILNLDKLKKFIFIEKLLSISGDNVFDPISCEILMNELTNFNSIIEGSPFKNTSSKSLYIEIGLIKTLRVFFYKIFCIAHKMSGKDFIKIYEIIVLFLYLKLYISTDHSIQNYEEQENKNSILKSIDKIRNSKKIINWKKTSIKDIEKIEKDIKKMSDVGFQALDYVSCYEIVSRHFFEFINQQQSQNLESLFDINVVVEEKEEVEALMKSFKNQIEKDLLNLVIKYENSKNVFEENSLFENLDDIHVIYKRNYRNLLIHFLFFIDQHEYLVEEYFSKNANILILRIFQKDTCNVQNEVYHLMEQNELNLENYIEIFFKQVLCVIFTNFNPSALEVNYNYQVCCTIIEIFSYLCEEHNQIFQDIILNKLEIELPSKKLKDKNNKSENQLILVSERDITVAKKKSKKIRFFNFLIMTLDKIILISDWVKTSNKDKEEEDISYFYHLFSCIIELLIETIQGTQKKNFQIFLRKNKKKHIIEHEYVIEKDKDEEDYIHSLEYFLLRSRELLYNQVTNSDTMYNVKKDLVNLLLAFLEEKECHQEIKDLIIHSYFPKNIMYPLIDTLKNYYISFVPKKLMTNSYEGLSKNDEIYSSFKFDETLYKRLIDSYCNGDFSRSIEFNYANTLYRYIKLLALEFENAEALSILQMRKEDYDFSIIGNEEEEFYYVKEFFEKITKSIWVKLSSGENTRVIFTVDPSIFYLSENSKRDFFLEVSRDNRYTKLSSLLFAKQLFFDEIHYNQNYLKNNSLLKWLSDINFYWTGVVAFFFCLGINIYMMSVFNDEYSEDNFKYRNNLLGLHLSMIIMTGVFIFLWFYSKFFYYFRKDKYIYIEKHKIQENQFTIWTFLYIVSVHTILGRGEILQLFWIFIWGILGAFKEFYFFYSIALLSVVGLSETLINIILAVKLKWKQLLSTLVFVLFVVYIYANLSFFFFNEDFKKTVKGETENSCDSLRSCYLTHILEGLRRHGGVGDIMKNISWINEPGHFFERFLFDFIFFIMVVVILLNVVFGIIIDTFRELRVNQHKTEKDRNTVCFICGSNKDELERLNIKFNQHTEEEHNIWNYVYYMIGLDLINVHNMNGINMEVHEKIKKMEISWIPSAEGNNEEKELKEK